MKKIANLLILAGVIIFFLVFKQVIKEELSYQFDQWSGIRYSLEADPNFPESQIRPIVPVNREFSIVIPKLNISAEAFPEVNPYDQSEFLPILKKGVAHAKGTFFPGDGKNIYLFAHSTDSFLNAGRYNAIFYLIGKLKNGDEIDIFYRNELFKYSVFEKKVVQPGAIKYLRPDTEEILTLQTCYPPGTTLERLIVRAQKI